MEASCFLCHRLAALARMAHHARATRRETLPPGRHHLLDHSYEVHVLFGAQNDLSTG